METSEAVGHVRPGPLDGYRICDLSGQLAGAGATRLLAAFGADVIRVEDPVRQGRWDLLRGRPPFVDNLPGINRGGAFNSHNVGKRGITINLRAPEGKDLLRSLIAVSDVVTENFSAGVMDKLGFGFDALEQIRPGIIYVSNSGFGHTGPYSQYRSWGPVVQAVTGLTAELGRGGLEPAGWGYSLMDHIGANVMAVAILAALAERETTGKGQAIDLACTEGALPFLGPILMDVSAHGRERRRDDQTDPNGSEFTGQSPHGVFATAGDDRWIAVACRDDDDWRRLALVVDEPWALEERWEAAEQRLAAQRELEALLAAWLADADGAETASTLRRAGVPASVVARPEERIDLDPFSEEFGLWPVVDHTEIGSIRVDGIPFHLSESDWQIERGAPCLGEHNDEVLRDVLGLDESAISELRGKGVI